MERLEIKRILEAALMAASEPLSLEQLIRLFGEGAPSRNGLRSVIEELAADYADRAVELSAVAGGYRFQVRETYALYIRELYGSRPQKDSRALLETLALIAYRQPVTRGEIEEIRGVSTGSNIFRTLQDRDWIRTVGRRDVPGRPWLYGTTKAFLAHFNLRTLDDLPALRDVGTLPLFEGEAETGDNVESAPAGADPGGREKQL